MTDILLEVSCLSKRYGGLVATDNVSLAVASGELHSIIGPNGAGKTTLLAQISGEVIPSSGWMKFGGEDITSASPQARARLGIARSFQITNLFPDLTAAENVGLAIQSVSGHSYRFWRAASTDSLLRTPALRMLERVGISDVADTPAGLLSHGDQRLLELGIALAMKPRLLVLDEPMAGLGRSEAKCVTALLSSLKNAVTMVLVEHDMDAVFELSDRITVLALGRVIATGEPALIRGHHAVREAYLGKEAA